MSLQPIGLSMFAQYPVHVLQTCIDGQSWSELHEMTWQNPAGLHAAFATSQSAYDMQATTSHASDASVSQTAFRMGAQSAWELHGIAGSGMKSSHGEPSTGFKQQDSPSFVAHSASLEQVLWHEELHVPLQHRRPAPQSPSPAHAMGHISVGAHTPEIAQHRGALDKAVQSASEEQGGKQFSGVVQTVSVVAGFAAQQTSPVNPPQSDKDLQKDGASVVHAFP